MSPGVRFGVLIALLTAANTGHIPLLRRFTRAGADKSAFQLCAIKETISSFGYVVWFECSIRGDTFVFATSTNWWQFNTLALFPSLLVITYLGCNVPIFWFQKYIITKFYCSFCFSSHHSVLFLLRVAFPLIFLLQYHEERFQPIQLCFLQYTAIK